LWVFLSAPAQAQIKPGAFTLSPFVGGFWFEGNQDLKNKPVYGLRLGQEITKTWGAELVLDYVKTKYKPTDANTHVYNYRLEGLYHFMPESNLVPFVAAGIGGMTLDYRGGKSDRTRFTPAYGAGLKYFFNERIALRADVRHVLGLGSVYNNLEYTVGLTFYFGGAKPAAAKAAEPPGKTEAVPPPPAVGEQDSDRDGVPDSRDKCPGTPAGVAVDASGCPVDSDKDGVPDYLDRCPGTPAGAAVDVSGCPLDSDGDGVPDYLDKCPGTPAGTAVDPSGCPIPPEKVSLPLKIEFDTGKADIKNRYHAEIEKAANFLKKYPAAKGTIAGHTDNVGSAAMNRKLSQRRAESVMNYLVKKFGIDPSRLTAKGYGMTQPVADNKTSEGRAKNRRIEAIFEATVTRK
jgi:OOP family OmpA-OmpF porin